MLIPILLLSLVVLCTGQIVNFVPAPNPMSWQEANAYCKEHETSLPIFHSHGPNQYFAIRARQQVVIDKDESWNRIWLAGHRSNGEFVGDGDRPLLWENFPVDARMDGDCVEMHLRDQNTFDENWDTDDCDVKKRFFCWIA